MNDLRGTVRNIDSVVTRLNEQALSQANLDNLKASITHLHETSGALAESSKKVGRGDRESRFHHGFGQEGADDLQSTIWKRARFFRALPREKDCWRRCWAIRSWQTICAH